MDGAGPSTMEWDALRLENLRLRDALIGAIGEIGRLRANEDRQSKVQFRELQGHLDNAVAHSADLANQIAALRQSHSWRVGNFLMRPLSVFRRAIGR